MRESRRKQKGCLGALLLEEEVRVYATLRVSNRETSATQLGMKLDYVHHTMTLDHSGLHSRQWGAKTYNGKFSTEPLPGDDAWRDRKRKQRADAYKEKWSKVKIAADEPRKPKKLFGVKALVNRPQSAPAKRVKGRKVPFQEPAEIPGFTPIDVHPNRPRSGFERPSTAGPQGRQRIRHRPKSKRPFTAGTTRSQELREAVTHGEVPL